MGNSKITWIIFYLVTIFFHNSCKQTLEVVVPNTDLVAYVYDNNNHPIVNAIVSIFEKKEDFERAKEFEDFSNAVAIDTTDSYGMVKFFNLKPNLQYYFYCYFKDTSVVATHPILWDNTYYATKIERPLTKGAITYIKILLHPQEGFLIFWTGEDNKNKMPIEIKINNQFVGMLYEGTGIIAEGRTGLPEPFNPYTGVTVKLKRGIYKYVARGIRSSCIWLDTVSVNPGTIKYVKLENCNASSVTFIATERSLNSIPILVLLNARDTLGFITNVTLNSMIQDPCNINATPKVYLTSGKYSYKAISKNSSTVWTGTFDVKSDSCHVVKF
jgi:hypothetical protein